MRVQTYSSLYNSSVFSSCLTILNSVDGSYAFPKVKLLMNKKKYALSLYSPIQQ